MLTAPRRRPRRTSAPAQNLHDPSLYFNREISMLLFQRRVLEEAQDERNPLLERVKFSVDPGSNLSEFFMVRVAGLYSQLESGVQETGPDGLTPAQQLEAIRAEFEQLWLDAHACLRQLLAALEKHGIRVVAYADLNVEERAAARQFFEDNIYPVLTPLAFDPGRPFPHISNLSLNLSVLIRDPEGTERFARLKVPDGMPQLIPLRRTLRGRTGPLTLVWIEELITAHLDALFPGMRILEAHPFHVTRDAEMEIQELESADLLEEVEEGVRQRRFGAVVRLLVPHGDA
jgi:polyphosphate kinase